MLMKYCEILYQVFSEQPQSVKFPQRGLNKEYNYFPLIIIFYKFFFFKLTNKNRFSNTFSVCFVFLHIKIYFLL